MEGGQWTLEKTTSDQRPATSDLNKVWIIPAKAKVLESNGIVVVDEKRLKVMMAEDVESLDSQRAVGMMASRGALSTSSDVASSVAGDPSTAERTLDAGRLTLGKTTNIFRETILPSIEKEINEGKDFAAVRQVYNSVILAAWYKQALKESLLGRVYADQAKVAGVDIDDQDMKERVYAQYLEAFKKGAYNFIKEEEDASGELIPRKYFSGGIAEFGLASSHVLERQAVSSVAVEQPIRRASSAALVTVQGEELASAAVITGNLRVQSLPNEIEPKLAASSALTDYLLPVEDGPTRDAVKILARQLFALPEVIGVLEIEDFRVLLEQTDANLSLGDRLRVLNKSDQSLKTRAMAETLIIMQSEYPALFATAAQVDDVLQAFWGYSLNFESLEETMRDDNSIISARPLAVRQITSLLVLNEDSLPLNKSYLPFVFDYVERLREYQNLPEVPLRINEYLNEERDFFPAMTSTIENIRLGLSAEFLDSRDLDGFANIMQDVSILLKSFMVQQANYMVSRSGDKPAASSALIPTAAQMPQVMDLKRLRDRLDREWTSLSTDEANQIINRALAVFGELGNPDNIRLPNNGGNINRNEILGKRDVINREMKISVGERPFIPAGQWLAPNLEVEQGEESTQYWGHIVSYSDLYDIVFNNSGMLKSGPRQTPVHFYSSGQGQTAQVRRNGHAGIVPLIFTKKGFSDYGIGLGTGFGLWTLRFDQSVPLRLLAPYSKTFVWQAVLAEMETRGEALTDDSKVKIARALGYINYSNLEKNLTPHLEGLHERIVLWALANKVVLNPSASSAIKSEQIDQATSRIIGVLKQTAEFGTKIQQSSPGAQVGLAKLTELLLIKALPNFNISNPTIVQVNQWVTEAGIGGHLKNGFSTAEGSLSTPEIMAQYLGYRFENGSVSVVPQVIKQEITGLANSASSTFSSTATTVSSAAVGGINFDPTLLHLQIKRDGRGVPLPLPQQNIENINIEGLFPVIINIQPVNAQTLPLFLGQAPKQSIDFPILAVKHSG